MGLVDSAIMLIFMVGIIAPMVGVTWYSIREEFHTPAALRDSELDA